MRNQRATTMTGTRDGNSCFPAFELWEDAAPLYQELLNRPIPNGQALEQWIKDRSDLDSVLGETVSWRYINLSANSDDALAAERYQYAIKSIVPQIAPYDHQLNQKLAASPFLATLDPEKYGIYLRNVRNAVKLYHEDNVPLQTEIHLKTKEYGRIFSQMMIGVDGKQMTIQQANTILEETDRNRRQQIYFKINQRILQDTGALETLFDDLLIRRQQIAENIGFDNYRDYAFRSMGRLDYTPEDCLQLHEGIAAEILPILNDLYCIRKQELELDELRPWDLNNDTGGRNPLLPFNSIEELVDNSIVCLSQVNPVFGEVIRTIHEMGLLDLESRPGKRPGGYNMPLQASRLPYLFMNATHTLNDLRTLMHESGHAIHFYLTRQYDLLSARRFPSEIAELAAMTMELLTMEHWNIFFPDPADLKRAKITQLENVLKVLPWIATVDNFQHWLYTHPNHTPEERKYQWMATLRKFTPAVVDYDGLDHYLEYLWHKQLHLFEVPFYYIEYGFAQLGAIAIWRRYRQDPQTAIKDYMAALELGNTRPIREVYEAAGISFCFDKDYVAQLGDFVREEIKILSAE